MVHLLWNKSRYNYWILQLCSTHPCQVSNLLAAFARVLTLPTQQWFVKGKSLKITIHLQFTLFEPRQMGTVISHDPLHVNFLSIASRKLFSRSSMITSMRSGENFTTPVTVGSGFFVVWRVWWRVSKTSLTIKPLLLIENVLMSFYLLGGHLRNLWTCGILQQRQLWIPVVAIVGSCEDSVGEVQWRNALQMLKNTQFTSNLSKNILEEKFTSKYHVSNRWHENDSKSKSDDWKLQTWQWSLWNPLEPPRCVSSCPYSKHVQKSRNVYTKWLQGG